MDIVRTVRTREGLSQRELARRSGLSFRAVQLVERRDHDSRLSSLEKVAAGLGLHPDSVRHGLASVLGAPAESVLQASLRVAADGETSWKTHLFDLVDALRRSPDPALVAAPPADVLPAHLRALFAATVETLVREAGLPEPSWARTVGPLPEPWFPAGFESLKATALVESPIAFRARNVFVLGNFLARA